MKKIFVFLVVFYLAVFSWIGKVKAIELVEAAATSVEYALPYPGILPDSPFYFLKVARDQIMTFFVTDPRQKSFYLIFLSDKRAAAGEALIKGGKVALAKTTLEKGEEYFSQAVDLAGKTNDKDLLAKLAVSGAKHSEILAKANVPAAYQSSLESRKRAMELLILKK